MQHSVVILPRTLARDNSFRRILGFYQIANLGPRFTEISFSSTSYLFANIHDIWLSRFNSKICESLNTYFFSNLRILQSFLFIRLSIRPAIRCWRPRIPCQFNQHRPSSLWRHWTRARARARAFVNNLLRNSFALRNSFNNLGEVAKCCTGDTLCTRSARSLRLAAKCVAL